MFNVLVKPTEDGKFELRTSNGYPVGNRMISSEPEKGRAWPPERTVFEDRVEAARAAADWIVYLNGVRKKKRKGDRS